MPGRKKKDDKAVSLKDRIYLEAQELFLSEGYTATSTVEIARKAGCNQALVYYYFGSKEKLFLEVFREYMLKAVDAFYEPILRGDTLEKQVSGCVERYFRFLREDRRFASFFVNEFLMHKERHHYIRGIGNAMSFQRAYIAAHRSIRREIEAGRVRPDADAATIITDIVSMCISAFLAIGLFTDYADAEGTERYLKERQDHITDVILRSIRK